MEIIEAPVLHGCVRITTQYRSWLILITTQNNKITFTWILDFKNISGLFICLYFESLQTQFFIKIFEEFPLMGPDIKFLVLQATWVGIVVQGEATEGWGTFSKSSKGQNFQGGLGIDTPYGRDSPYTVLPLEFLSAQSTITKFQMKCLT